jgi:hypothetical protein
MAVMDVNLALMRIFGLKSEDLVTGLSLEALPQRLPQLTVTSVIVPGSPQAARLEEQTQLFELVLIKDPAPPQQPALDIDAICKAALERLLQQINEAAQMAREEVSYGFWQAKRRANQRHGITHSPKGFA